VSWPAATPVAGQDTGLISRLGAALAESEPGDWLRREPAIIRKFM